MKILIVDDEKIIRSGIVNLVNNIDSDILEVYQAKNGKDAYDVFVSNSPEIIITDIRMPLIDGVSLAKKVRDISDKIKIIFVTGHSDIEYLKAAFNNHVVNYVLKPVDTKELTDIIIDTINTVKQEKAQKKYLYLAEEKLKHSMPLLVNKFYKDIINGNLADYSDITKKIDLYQLPIEVENDFTIALMSINYKNSELCGGDNVVDLAVEDIINKKINENFYGICFSEEEEEIIVVIKSNDTGETLRQIFENIQLTLKSVLNIDAYTCIGPCVSGLMHISESYKYAKHNAEHRFFAFKEKIVFSSNSPLEYNSVNISPNYVKKFSDGIHSQDIISVKSSIDSIFNEFSNGLNDTEYVKTFSIMLISSVINLDDIVSHEIISTIGDFTRQIYKCKNIQENRNILFLFSKKYIEHVNYKDKVEYKNVIQEIIDMLILHISDNITIHDIANKIFLTPNYICNIFKKATNKTVNEYYTDLKIAEAKKLLRQSDFKIYQISCKVGYQDVKYFSKLFKQKEGITPTKYKEQQHV